MLFIFSSGTGPGHLEEAEEHNAGQLVKCVAGTGCQSGAPQPGGRRGRRRDGGADIVREEQKPRPAGVQRALFNRTSQLPAACCVTHVDVFGFRETKASSANDVTRSVRPFTAA